MNNKVLTANRLGDGIAVWLDAECNWTENLQDAVVVQQADEIQALEDKGKAAYASNQVVDVNLVDVQQNEGMLWPVRLRERIRAQGPTMAYAPGFHPADPDFIDP